MVEIISHSMIWLGMASKYLEHNKDDDFEKEFDCIWRFFKTGQY